MSDKHQLAEPAPAARARKPAAPPHREAPHPIAEAKTIQAAALATRPGGTAQARARHAANLQRQMGNAYVSRLLTQPSAAESPTTLADRATGPVRSAQPTEIPALHRAPEGRAEAAPSSQDRHADGDDGHLSPVQRSTVHDLLRGSGQPLDRPVREEMESRLGADFSDVRLHTGPAAQRSAEEIGARAYTCGDHVVISDGGADKHTLAHELTHVIQQRHGPVSGSDTGHGFAVSDPGDRFERHAEGNAARVMMLAPVPLAGPRQVDGATQGQSSPSNASAAPVVQRNGQPRPSREERKRKREDEKLAPKHGRNTREAKKARAQLEALGKDPAKLAAEVAAREEPKEFVPKEGENKGEKMKIFKGGRTFSEKFRKKFWELAGPQPTCGVCKGKIEIGEARHIDHKKPWGTLKTELSPVKVCKSGYHWDVVSEADANNVIYNGSPEPSELTDLRDRPNLQPAHEQCNTSKGGPTDTDPITPLPLPGGGRRERSHQLDELCPDKLPKADGAAEAEVESSEVESSEVESSEVESSEVESSE